MNMSLFPLAGSPDKGVLLTIEWMLVHIIGASSIPMQIALVYTSNIEAACAV